MTETRLEAVFQNKEFAKAFADAETPEDAAALLKQAQVEISLEQVKQMRLFVNKAKEGEIDPKQYLDENGQLKAELTPDELENVAGGTSILTTLFL